MLSATAPYPSLPIPLGTAGAREAAQQDRTDQPGRPGQRTAVIGPSGRSGPTRALVADHPVGSDPAVRAADQGEVSRAAEGTGKRALRQTVWAWLRLLGGAAILAVVLWQVGSAAFLDGLRVLDGATLATALGIGAVTTVCSAWRWCLVARGLGIRLRLGNAIADYYRALFLNAALPGGVLGDVHRAVRHGRDVGDLGRGVRAVVLERAAGQLVLVTVSVVVLLTHPVVLRAGLDAVAATPAGTLPMALLGVAILVTGGTGVAVRARRARRRRDRGESHTGSRWRRAVRNSLNDVRRGLLAHGNWPWIALASTVALAGHLATFVVAARAAGASAPIGLLVPLMLLALLAMTLPLNVGGWGPREGVCAWAFGAAGLSATQGLTVAVVYGLFAFVASLPGAVVLLARWIQRPRPGHVRPQHAGPQHAGGRLVAQAASNRSDSA